MRSGQVIRDSHIILMVLSAFRKKQIVHTFFYLSSELVARCKPSLGSPLFRKAASYGPIIGTETSGRVGTLRAVSFNIWGLCGPLYLFLSSVFYLLAVHTFLGWVPLAMILTPNQGGIRDIIV